MQSDANLVILGGGCAGLSLAMRLAEFSGLDKKIIILEARTTYENDRTWCFWKTAPHRFEALITKSWSKMSIGFGQRKTISDCSKTPYQMLESGRFYDCATDKIRRSAHVDLRLGVHVSEMPSRSNNQWQIQTDLGVLTSDSVVDTRPERHLSSRDAVLWQSFSGHEIECERAIFDPEILELMDFLPSFDGNVHFSYTLPISETRALVETTVFGPSRMSAAALAEFQNANLARVCQNADFKVRRTESGILPMGLTRPVGASAAGYVQAGLFHGGARPSSGYAFQRIQRWADECASAINRGEWPCAHAPDGFATRAMDSLFLKVLRNSPEKGAEIFTRLFERVDPARIIRFLSDTGGLADKFAIISALPASLFIRQLLSHTAPALLKGVAR